MMMKILQNAGQKVVFLLAISVSMFILLPALAYEGLEYLGYEIIFGKELLNINPFNLGSLASAELPLSVMAFLAFFLPLVAGIIALSSKRYLFISLIIFTVSLFLLWTLPNYIDIVYTVAGNESTANVDWAKSIGLIGAFVTTSVAALLNLILVLTPPAKQ